MKIVTEQFGDVEYTADKVIKFKNGLFGFEHLQDYLLIKTEDELFFWLMCINKPELTFPLIGLKVLDEGYPAVENHEVFGIVTLNSDPRKVTVNLKAPVYIDHVHKTGYQIIFDEDKYSVNYNLFVEEK